MGILSEQDILTDDIVTAINGNEVKTIGQFTAIYDGLQVDASVELSYQRKGDKLKLSFKKPTAKGGMLLRK